MSAVAFLGLFYGLPGLVALLPAWGDWRIVLKAYGIWLALLFGSFLLMTGNLEEGFGWAAIYGMFFTIVAVPVLSLILKLWSICRRPRVAGQRV